MATTVWLKETCTGEWSYSDMEEESQWMKSVLVDHGYGRAYN